MRTFSFRGAWSVLWASGEMTRTTRLMKTTMITKMKERNRFSFVWSAVIQLWQHYLVVTDVNGWVSHGPNSSHMRVKSCIVVVECLNCCLTTAITTNTSHSKCKWYYSVELPVEVSTINVFCLPPILFKDGGKHGKGKAGGIGGISSCPSVGLVVLPQWQTNACVAQIDTQI